MIVYRPLFASSDISKIRTKFEVTVLEWMRLVLQVTVSNFCQCPTKMRWHFEALAVESVGRWVRAELGEEYGLSGGWRNNWSFTRNQAIHFKFVGEGNCDLPPPLFSPLSETHLCKFTWPLKFLVCLVADMRWDVGQNIPSSFHLTPREIGVHWKCNGRAP